LGNDILIGGLGADLLDGGGGVDLADYSGSSEGLVLDLVTSNSGLNSGAALGDTLKLIEDALGTDFADTISGSARGNHIDGGAGNDELIGRNGNDTLSGGFGSDRLFGGNGADTLRGQSDNDILFGGGGRDVLIGGNGNDDLRGQAGDDVLRGDAGNDRLLGYEGADELDGGTGDDFLDGAIGNDILLGGAGNDTLNGGNNDDVLNGGAGNDDLIGGNGADTYVFSASDDGTDRVIGLDASDMLVFEGFGYASASDALGFVIQQGNNAVFSDQGVTVVFNGRSVADVEAALGNAGSSVSGEAGAEPLISQIDIYRGIDTFDFSGLDSGDGGPIQAYDLPEYAWTNETPASVILPQFDTLHDDMTGFDVAVLQPDDGFSFVA
jgi:Ca2+-binding RTX toxin-like protein